MGSPATAVRDFREAIGLKLSNALLEDAYLRSIEAAAKAGDSAEVRNAYDRYRARFPLDTPRYSRTVGRQTLKANRQVGLASVALGLCFLALIGNARAEPLHLDESNAEGVVSIVAPSCETLAFSSGEFRQLLAIELAAEHLRLREPAAEGAPAPSLGLVLDVAAGACQGDARDVVIAIRADIKASPSSARSLSAISRQWLERVLLRWRQPSNIRESTRQWKEATALGSPVDVAPKPEEPPANAENANAEKTPEPVDAITQRRIRSSTCVPAAEIRARPIVALLCVFPNVTFRRSAERHTPTCAGQSPTAGGRRRRVGNSQRSSWHREPLDSFRWPRCHFCDDEQSRRLRRTARRDRLCARQRNRKRNGYQTGSRRPSRIAALSLVGGLRATLGGRWSAFLEVEAGAALWGLDVLADERSLAEMHGAIAGASAGIAYAY